MKKKRALAKKKDALKERTYFSGMDFYGVLISNTNSEIYWFTSPHHAYGID